MSTEPNYGIDVLAFGPHPDDVEIFCGGVMITMAELGYRTGIVDLTRGELGSRGDAPGRRQEAEAAAHVLGLALRENLGLPDGFIDPSPRSPHLPVVVAALRRHRPELVLVPWIEERHPDHVAASQLLTRALFLAHLEKYEQAESAPPFAPRQALFYELRHRMTPSFIVDTSKAWERKVRAIACHESQVARRDAAAATLVSSPLALPALEARDGYRGSEIGVRYGEALRATQSVGIVDPLAHLRANPFPNAYAFPGLR